MLLSTMNPAEITAEVRKDYDTLLSTTILRLGSEYERERKKKKIDARRTYTRLYTVKTARKNNWIIVIGKAPSREKYTDITSLTHSSVTYFYDKEGLKVYHPCNLNIVQVYKGHFFQRYNQRLNLGLSNPVDIIKRYFYCNRFCCEDMQVRNGKIYMIGFSKAGLLLGEFQHHIDWILWRTFISRDLVRDYQQRKEKDRLLGLFDCIQKEAKNQYDTKKFWSNLDKWESLSDTFDVD